jgi:HEAT repeat protein
MKLENIVKTTPASKEIRDDTILQIASLLNNRNVRLWAALALGDIGPRAVIAVPQLNAALKEADAEEKQRIGGPDLSTADAIRDVLSEITGKTHE